MTSVSSSGGQALLPVPPRHEEGQARVPVLHIAILLLIATTATAQTRRAFEVGVHESATFRMIGATAAYAIDAAIADASATNGDVILYGKSAGHTQVVIINVTGETTFDVVVTARQSIAAQTKESTNGRVEARYASAGQQVHNSVDVAHVDGQRRTEAHVETARYGDYAGQQTSVTLPSIAYRMFSPGREITLFDRYVNESPLTVSGTTVRGFHFIDDRWRIHAGTTAYAAYQSFLLPAQRERVVGAGYALPLSATSRLTPSLYVLQNGTVASLLYDYVVGERLVARGELGVSRGVAAAAQLAMTRERDQLRIDLRYRPSRFPVATLGEQRGVSADSSYTKTFGRGSTADAAFSAYRFDFPGFAQRSIAASTNVRLRTTDTLSLLGGMSFGEFGDARTLTVPLGVQFDWQHAGLSAVARWAQSSTTNRGGPGFRLGGRTSVGRFFATAYVDYQQQAATLALIYREQPDLALALAQLGITATTPADIARALRENSALAALGYIDGVTVELTPTRIQGGFEMAWLGSGPARPQLRARLLFNRNESVATRTDTIIGTLTGSRRITDATDVFASFSWWKTRRRGSEAIVQPLVEAGVRHRFEGIPSWIPSYGGISGSVFLDENLDGASDGAGVADAEVELDGAKRMRTARDGSFSFKSVGRGPHRVVARVPRESDAFFTTPSRVEAGAGDVVKFGVAFTPARLFGRVVSDAGDGIAAVAFTLMRGTARVEARSDSSGAFSMSGAPGEWTLALDTASLPPGYSTTEALEQSVQLERATPRSTSTKLRANRSVSGRAPAGVIEIVVEPLGLHVPVDAEGRFSVRSLPAGELTLRAGAIAYHLTMPVTPTSINDVVLGGGQALLPVPSSPFALQLGAFRHHGNAIELLDRVRALGVAALLVPGERLTFVRTEPLPSRERAEAVSQRLARAGIPAILIASSSN
jgi:SPOR domain